MIGHYLTAFYIRLSFATGTIQAEKQHLSVQSENSFETFCVEKSMEFVLTKVSQNRLVLVASDAALPR